MKSTNEKKIANSTFWTVIVFYLLIAFEFFYMASPFAAYFYSVYKPGIVFLNKFPILAGSTGFFLPHLCEETNSTLLNLIKPAGVIITMAGFLTFLICAGQIYYSKIFKKGVVTGGLYKLIRHPQYLAFIVCGFGLLLLWPRYLVVIMYVSLLFAYYILAKVEEKECKLKYGQSYLDYANNTYMFIPFKLSFINTLKNSRFLQQNRIIMIIVFFLVSISIALLLARGIKNLAVQRLYAQYNESTITISIYENTEARIKQITDIVRKDIKIDSLVNQAEKENKLINYIYPAGMYISEIPMNKPENAKCHIYNQEKNDMNMQAIIFTKANLRDKDAKGSKILIHTLSTTPIIEVWVNLTDNKITEMLEPPKVKRYENIPEPIF